MKRTLLLVLFSFMLLFGINNNVRADSTLELKCDNEAVSNIAKIVYHEAGRDDSSYENVDEAFYAELMTASIILNNVNYNNPNSNSSLSDKVYNVNSLLVPYPCFGGKADTYTNNNNTSYCGDVINYRTWDINDYITDRSKRGQMLYIAGLVVSGKFNLPKNMYLQASESIVSSNGTVFDHVKNTYLDLYFGYGSPNTLSSTDVFGRQVGGTTPEYYRALANKLKLSSYASLTSRNVCDMIVDGETVPRSGFDDDQTSGQTGNGDNNGSNSGTNNTVKKPEIVYTVDVPTCENPEILKVIYFARLIFNIVKIIIPIGLIVMGAIDFSKSVSTSDDGEQKKNLKLFIKRIIYALLVFFVPWIVGRIIVILGNVTSKEVNFTDCLENATSSQIEVMQKKYDELLEQEQQKHGNTQTGNDTEVTLNNFSNESENSGNNTVIEPNNTKLGKKILLAAGHSFTPYCSKATNECREGANDSPSEPVETRKITKLVKKRLLESGYKSNQVDIINELFGENLDDPSTSKSFYIEIYSGSSTLNSINFSDYQYGIEFHFNAAPGGNADGTTILCGNYCSLSDNINSSMKKDIQSVLSNTTRSIMAQSTSTINFMGKKGIPYTLLEVEFYDNTKALNNYHNHIDGVVNAIVQNIKRYYPPE